jgi:hypothetical protein
MGVPGKVGHNGRAIRPGFEDSRDARERDPADPNKGDVADFLLPFRYARQALRREGHGFQGSSDRLAQARYNPGLHRARGKARLRHA